jgi:hypothetical protein
VLTSTGRVFLDKPVVAHVLKKIFSLMEAKCHYHGTFMSSLVTPYQLIKLPTFPWAVVHFSKKIFLEDETI